MRAVERDSRAWANGLRPGDIITSVNQRAVSELKDFYEIVNREESALLLHVLRGGVWGIWWRSEVAHERPSRCTW